MDKLKTLRVLENELGTVLKSGLSDESFYYSAEWDEIRWLARRAARVFHHEVPTDVRAAHYALDLLGIPNHCVEADQDERGAWMVYWR